MSIKSSLAILFVFITFVLPACGSSQSASAPVPTPQPTTAPTPVQQEGVEHTLREEPIGHGQELHEAAHGGQVGMAMDAAGGGGDLHLEIVSDTPGQYEVYLSDENRQPVSPEGYEGALAIIRSDGSEIASMPLMVTGDHLQAEGGPTDVSQIDVRITLKGPGLSDTVEMDFTIPYIEK